MGVVDSVGMGDVLLVKAAVANLAAPDEQDRRSSWVERVEDSIRVASVLDAELAHVAVLGSTDVRRVRRAEGDALRLEQAHVGGDALLLVLRKSLPPSLKFVGVFHLTCHGSNITPKNCLASPARAESAPPGQGA